MTVITTENGDSRLRMITTREILKFMGIPNSLNHALCNSRIDDDLVLGIALNYLLRAQKKGIQGAFEIEGPPSANRSILDEVEAQQEGRPFPDCDNKENWLVEQGLSRKLSRTIAEMCNWSDCKQFPNDAQKAIKESIQNGELRTTNPEWAPKL